MKTFIFSLLFLGATSFISAQEQAVQIVSSMDDIKTSLNNENLSLRFSYSLNKATKKNIKLMALEQFKALASSKGYTHLYINETASSKKQHEIRKRRHTVMMVGVAYK